MTDTVAAETLQTLHRIHQQIGELKSRLALGPRQTAVADTASRNLLQQRDDAKEALKRARMASDDKQLQLKEREERVKDLESKLNACSTNREYQALKEQIAADEQANSVLADEILESLEKLDELEAGVKDSELHLAAAEAEAKKVHERVANEGAALEAELSRVEAELEATERQLPADFRPEYLRLSRARGEEALAPVEGEFCGGCNQQLSPQTMNELYLSRPVFCKSCGTLLYLPEDSSV